MLTDDQLAHWDRDRFVVLRGFAAPSDATAVERETIAAIRHDPPCDYLGEPGYVLANGILVPSEAKVPT